MTTKTQDNQEKRAMPRLGDVLAEKTRDPHFAKLFDEEMAALRLGLALCEARERLNLTQQDIANRSGVPQETLSRIERTA